MNKVAKLNPQFSDDAIKDATALIQGMELPYLQQLQSVLSVEIDKRHKDERRDAIAKIRSIAAAAGVDLESLVHPRAAATPKGTKKVVTPAPVKFQHPDNPALQWSGRGRQKEWVKQFIESGKSIEDARIA